MLRRPAFWFTAVAIWFLTLFVLSHQSHLHPPGPQFDQQDKVYHAGYFTLGAACLFLGLRARQPAMRISKAVIITVLFCVLMGAFDEFHQSFIPNRSGNDVGDWLADSAGGILGSLLGMVLLRVPGLRMKKQPCEP